MTDHLQHKQGLLLASLMTGKLPRNLSWSEVVELMGSWVKSGRARAMRLSL